MTAELLEDTMSQDAQSFSGSNRIPFPVTKQTFGCCAESVGEIFYLKLVWKVVSFLTR